MSAPALSLGYVMRDYPVLYHATVLNEIRVLRELGYPVRVFSLLEPDEKERRGGLPETFPTATYCWASRASRVAVARANHRIVARVGLMTYRRAYRLARAGGLVGNVSAFARLAHHADEQRRAGVTHFHAHWATEAATTALVFSWLTGLPFSFTAHAYDIFRAPQFFDLKLAQARFAVTVSEYNRRYIVEKFGPGHPEKVHVIYPLIDLATFPLRARPVEAEPRILSVGRLTEYKGFAYLLDACRILRDRGLRFTCQIVGQGEEEAALRETIARLGLEDRVELLGALPHEDIPGLLERASVFALPCVIGSNGDRDGMPLVLIEAMARGVPVVSSDLIGLPELVRDGAGFLASPGDSVALADALEKVLLLSPEEQEAMGRAGRAIVKQFDATRGVDHLLDLIQRFNPGAAPRPALEKGQSYVPSHR